MSKIGIIGGSALEDIEELEIINRVRVKTPFGEPSDEFVAGKLSGKEVIFLHRHGRGHKFMPHEVNYRANIYAFKTLGVNSIFSVSAVGSLKENIKPLDVVLVDQFVDRTKRGKEMTFFGEGIVAHIPFAEPVCKDLREIIHKANKELDINIHLDGTYINMEGPAFSTRAESELYRSWGMDIIGMTNIAEARLAREAGICYATIAMVTDYDCWYEREGIETVSVDMIMENVMKNIEVAKKILKNSVAAVPVEKTCECRHALRHAVMTAPEVMPRKTLEKLKPIMTGHE